MLCYIKIAELTENEEGAGNGIFKVSLNLSKTCHVLKQVLQN